MRSWYPSAAVSQDWPGQPIMEPARDPEEEAPADSRLLLLARRLGVSRAVMWAVLTRGWQVVGGGVTILVVARFYTPEQQGFYYAFISLLAMQTFFELGLLNVVVIVAAHEWAHRDGPDENQAAIARARLRSLGRLLIRWYAVVAALYFVTVSTVGFLMLSGPGGTSWEGPWATVVALTALLLLCLPFNALLEGCGRLAKVQRFFLIQFILAAVALWVVIPAGGGLWAIAASASVRLLSNAIFLLGPNREFLRDLLRKTSEAAGMSWREEVWPLQWRIGVQGAVSWFHYSAFVPILFHFHGPDTAGRFGMTWQIINVLQVGAFAWVHTRMPEMGIHVARRDFGALDALWRKAVGFSLGVLILGAIAFEVALLAIPHFLPHVAGRLLGPESTAILLLGRLASQIVLGAAAYVRAHKIEPFAPMMVTVSLLQGAAGWLMAQRYGSSGVAVSYAAISIAIALPWGLRVLARTRRSRNEA